MALDIPPALYTTTNGNGLVIPQSSASVAGNFLILRSTQDASLPDGRIVCSHGMQDNLGTATDIGLDNPDCAGDAMYYQLGTTITNIAAGGFTLANGTTTNTSVYDDVQSMWTAESSGSNPSAMTFCNASGTAAAPTCATNIGPDHWIIEDMEARMAAGNQGTNYIVTTGSTAATASQDATHIHFRRDWLHGDWADLAHGANAISAALNLSDCIYCSVVDSQTSELLRPGAECHAITANGTNFKIDHNWLEGCGPGIFSGGYSNTAGPNIAGWIPNQDTEIRRNRLTWPYAWLGQSPVSGNVYWTNTFSLVRKNGIEAKEGERLLVAGNIVENVDNSGAQNGVEFDFNVWNSSGGVPGANYQAVVTDLTFANNIARNSCDGFEIDGAGRNLGGMAQPFQRGMISNNLLYNASQANPGCSTATSTGISLESSLNQWQGTVTESASGVATFTATCSVYQGGCIGQLSGAATITSGTGCVNGALNIPPPDLWTTGGIQATGTYTCSGGGLGGVTITNPGTGYVSSPTATLASGTGSAVLAIYTTATAPTTGFQQLDLVAGQPFSITQCENTAFNVGLALSHGFYYPTGLGPFTTSSSGLNVSYPWTGATAGTTDSGGYCMLANFPGGPESLQFIHNTFITDATHGLTSSDTNTQTAGPNYQWQARLQDDILLGGGWFNNPLGEGCSTINFNYDTSSLTDDHLVWPGRTSSLYSGCAYGNNPKFPAASPAMYFPATANCTGATSSSGCVGFVGAMSTSTMPLTLPDYHGFELRSDSWFYAGNAEDASDGSSIGADVAAIDAAQTQNTYVCASACGSPGPFPDSAAVAPTTLFGFTENNTAAGNWPSTSYSAQRFWDSPPLQWPGINTAAGAFDFTSLDAVLAQAYANGAMESMYTLARTPPWATSGPNDTSCDYPAGTSNGGNGECDPPSDLNADGSGANAIWKEWITAIAGHVNDAVYLQSHAHIKYWEIWNEPDTQVSWSGSIAQLARLTEDANCIITGRGVVHQSGNGSAAVCTATAIDPNARIVMASAHAKVPALTYGQNELYCNNTSGIPSYELPCPNPANAIASAVDIINFHMKPGNESGNNCPAPTPCTAEATMQWYVANIEGILQAAEKAKPLWDGEAAYSTGGFTGAYADGDMAASFMPRFYLVNWTLGISAMAWYTWDELATEPAEVETAYEQTYSWLGNSSLVSPCSAAGTVWSCTIAKNGIPYLILWDTAQSCGGGICTTANQTVGAQWIQYRDMTAASDAANIVGHTVAVGIKPVLLN
jgi:hypothetical protein